MINVFGWENNDLTILWISHKNKEIKRINLMLMMNEENSHYCWIKNMGRLLYSKTKMTAGAGVFMAASLDSLVKATPQESLNKTEKLAADLHGPFDLLVQNGVYPYEYMDSFAVTRKLSQHLVRRRNRRQRFGTRAGCLESLWL